MKPIGFFSVLILLCLGAFSAHGQEYGSVDVIDYDLSLDLSAGAPFRGEALLTMRMVEASNSIGLSLIGTVDSVEVNGERVEVATLREVPTAGLAAGEEFTVRVWYTGNGYVESYGWGGFHFDRDMSYNLGVAFNEDPHVIGRAMFPCRDNFTDKATYTLRVKTRSGWTAQCSGVRQESTIDAGGCEHSVWRIAQQVPTYLVSVSQADFKVIETSVQSTEGTYPVTLGYTTQDSASVREAFALLDSVVPMYERCFGPYRWGRIGYIPTRQGSMEHVNNIALARDFMATVSQRGQSTIAHELGHAWFGNLITCSSEGDMWINEGGATFCSEVAREATHGRASANAYYQQNLESVLRTTHLTDGGYLPLHNMPHALTYGSTTYDKGALVWHSLRGYLGDELFYASIRQLMQRASFGNLDAEAVRDSLSAYSGVDLTDFFAFHVMDRGFVDYHLDLVASNEAAGEVQLRILQQGVGTTGRVLSNRVPVQLWTWEGNSYDIVVAYGGADTVIDLRTYLAEHYPEVPTEAVDGMAFAVLDPNMHLSDAATYADISVQAGTLRGGEAEHIRLQAGDIQQPIRMHVEHHWGAPFDLAGTAGVVRTAQRYWVVNSLQYGDPALQGRLRYVRGGYSDATYTDLDRAWYTRASSLDSIEVMYRPDAHSEWQAISHRRNGNGNEGFFLVDNFRAGEYTLAVVDREQLATKPAPLPHPTIVNLFPNPVEHGGEIALEVDINSPFAVSIYDATGKLVWSQRQCRSGQKLRPQLPRGHYLVRIENNTIALQTNLIQL